MKLSETVEKRLRDYGLQNVDLSKINQEITINDVNEIVVKFFTKAICDITSYIIYTTLPSQFLIANNCIKGTITNLSCNIEFSFETKNHEYYISQVGDHICLLLLDNNGKEIVLFSRNIKDDEFEAFINEKEHHFLQQFYDNYEDLYINYIS